MQPVKRCDRLRYCYAVMRVQDINQLVYLVLLSDFYSKLLHNIYIVPIIALTNARESKWRIGVECRQAKMQRT